METLEQNDKNRDNTPVAPPIPDDFKNLEHTATLGLDLLEKGGADRARCVATHWVTREISADAGVFSLYRTLFSDSASFMAIDPDGRRGTLSQNATDDDAIREGAATCLESVRAADPDKNWQLAPALPPQKFESGPLDCDEALLFQRSRELLETIRERFPKIMVESMIVSHTSVTSCAAYSTGSRFYTRGGEYGVSVMFSAHEGTKASSFFSSGFDTHALDRPFIEMGSLEADLAMVSDQIDTRPLDGAFKGTVLMAPDCFAGILYDAIDTYAMDDVLIEGTSPWKDKLGEPVASPLLYVEVAPLHPDILNGERFTSEGYLSENYTFIENGVLRQFFLSDYASRRTGLKRAPNQSWNLVIRGGDKTVDDLIASIDRGVLIGRLSGGQPSSNGDFSAVAKNTFLIENGKISHALNETMINGNLGTLLLDVSALSTDVIKYGNVVLPWAAIDNVLISGK